MTNHSQKKKRIKPFYTSFFFGFGHRNNEYVGRPVYCFDEMAHFVKRDLFTLILSI